MIRPNFLPSWKANYEYFIVLRQNKLEIALCLHLFIYDTILPFLHVSLMLSLFSHWRRHITCAYRNNIYVKEIDHINVLWFCVKIVFLTVFTLITLCNTPNILYWHYAYVDSIINQSVDHNLFIKINTHNQELVGNTYKQQLLPNKIKVNYFY